MWSNSLVSGKQRSWCTLQKGENQRYRLNVFIYIACVCVVGTFSIEKMTQCINTIHKYAKHLLWMMRILKKIRWRRREKKSLMDVRGGISQSSHWRGSDGRQRLIPGWLSCRSAKMRTDGSFLLKDYVLKRSPLCQSEIWRPSFSHRVNSKERASSESRGRLKSDHSGAMHAKLSYYSTYVYIQYNHIYMCFLDCDKVVFYSLLYRWCKL